MLIQHIEESREGGLSGTTVEEVSDLQALYRASKKRFDEDESFKKRAREAVTQLQGGNPAHVQVGFFRKEFAAFCGGTKDAIKSVSR